jgi:hypothetical protein
MANLEVNFWAVAFLDLLGMRDALRRLDFDPGDTNETAVVEAMRDSVGAMEKFKDVWRAFEDGQNDSALPAFGAALPPEAQAILKRWRRIQLKHTQLGDALVLYVPLYEAEDNSPVRGFQALLAACASLLLMQLAVGHPVRGGIDIGAGVEHPTGGLYSAALVKAYDLESKVAKYPRIVVGDGVEKYLRWIRSRRQENWLHKLDAGIVANIEGLLCPDPTDGHQIVDFLGKTFRDQVASGLDRKIVRDAQAFAISQVAHWTQNDKLAERYRHLAAYFEKRMYLW